MECDQVVVSMLIDAIWLNFLSSSDYIFWHLLSWFCNCLGCPLLNSVDIFHVLWGPKLDTVFHMWSHECWVKGNKYFSQSTDHASANTVQDTRGHLCCSDTSLAHVHHDCSPTSLYRCLGSSFLRTGLHISPYLMSSGSCLGHSSTLSRSLWIAALPLHTFTASH